MLTEKYRPRSLNGIVGQDKIIKELKNFIKRGEVPNLLFYGNIGTGKTATAKAFIYDLLGEKVAGNIIILNASSERSIQQIRRLIIGTRYTSINFAPYKFIVLDELDGIGHDALNALRAPMENSGHTRFILICNNLGSVNLAIMSRSVMFHFLPIEEELVLKRLEEICYEEEITIKISRLKKISKSCYGDLRSAINELERYIA